MIVFCGASESDAVAINNVPVNEDFGGRGGRVEDRGLGDQDTACGCGCRHRLLGPLGKSRALPNSRLQTRRSLGRWILAMTPTPTHPQRERDSEILVLEPSLQNSKAIKEL